MEIFMKNGIQRISITNLFWLEIGKTERKKCVGFHKLLLSFMFCCKISSAGTLFKFSIYYSPLLVVGNIQSFFFYLWLKEYESVGTASIPTQSLIDDFSCIFTGSRFPWSSYCIFLLLFDVLL